MFTNLGTAPLVIARHHIQINPIIVDSAMTGYHIANLRTARNVGSIGRIDKEDMETWLSNIVENYMIVTAYQAMSNSHNPHVMQYLLAKGVTSGHLALYQKILSAISVPSGLQTVLVQAFSPVELTNGALVVALPSDRKDGRVSVTAAPEDRDTSSAAWQIQQSYSSQMVPGVRSSFDSLAALVVTNAQVGTFGYVNDAKEAVSAGIPVGVLSQYQGGAVVWGAEEEDLDSSFFGLFGGPKSGNVISDFLLTRYRMSTDAEEGWMTYWALMFAEANNGVGTKRPFEKK